jgi:hypothetical protein
MVVSFQTVMLIITAIWLMILTILILRLASNFNTIFHKANKESITTILDKLVKDRELARKDIDSLFQRINKLEDLSQAFIQKIGLIRFNPFSDTGGDQSFILALLDNDKSGIVISGLYARSGMRWYVKRIKKSQGIDHELSIEEQKAIDSAK